MYKIVSFLSFSVSLLIHQALAAQYATSFFEDAVPDAHRLERTHIYVGSGFSLPKGLAFSGTFILKNRWGGSVSWNYLNQTSKALPSDYSTGDLFNFNILNDNKPHDISSIVSFRALREFPTRSRRVRFGAEIGFSVVRTKFSIDFKPQYIPCDIFGCYSNYTYTTDKNLSPGLSLKGKLEFPLTIPFGLEIGLIANMNAQRSYIGLDFLTTLGYVRDEI